MSRTARYSFMGTRGGSGHAGRNADELRDLHAELAAAVESESEDAKLEVPILRACIAALKDSPPAPADVNALARHRMARKGTSTSTLVISGRPRRP